MIQLKIPLHLEDAKRITIYTKETEMGTLYIECFPGWPCLEKDGRGKTTDFWLEAYIVDKVGNKYELKEIINDY